MTQGRVLWYCDAIGYGFIHPDEEGGKILVPRTGIDGSGPRFLENGAKVTSSKVTYEAIQGREGMEAKSVSTV
jgi:cold shock CspA family protein